MWIIRVHTLKEKSQEYQQLTSSAQALQVCEKPTSASQIHSQNHINKWQCYLETPPFHG